MTLEQIIALHGNFRHVQIPPCPHFVKKSVETRTQGSGNGLHVNPCCVQMVTAKMLMIGGSLLG